MVRRTTLVQLVHLLQEDYLKIRGKSKFFLYFLQTLLDQSREIQVTIVITFKLFNKRGNLLTRIHSCKKQKPSTYVPCSHILLIFELEYEIILHMAITNPMKIYLVLTILIRLLFRPCQNSLWSRDYWRGFKTSCTVASLKQFSTITASKVMRGNWTEQKLFLV